MAKVTPDQAYAKLASRLKGATQDIRNGVNNVTTAPGVQAAAKQDKMLQNVQTAITSGKWATRVKSVSLSDWQTAMVNKGIPRISAGIDAAQAKSTAFFQQLLPFQDNLKAQISNMPDLTLEDNIARSAQFIRGMAGFQRK